MKVAKDEPISKDMTLEETLPLYTFLGGLHNKLMQDQQLLQQAIYKDQHDIKANAALVKLKATHKELLPILQGVESGMLNLTKELFNVKLEYFDARGKA